MLGAGEGCGSIEDNMIGVTKGRHEEDCVIRIIQLH